LEKSSLQMLLSPKKLKLLKLKLLMPLLLMALLSKKLPLLELMLLLQEPNLTLLRLKQSKKLLKPLPRKLLL
jgi:hypothetical protein